MTDEPKLPVLVSSWGLSPQQAAFVAHYVTGMNGANAARAAGYASDGAKGVAWRLLNRHKGVMAAVSATRNEIVKAAEVTTVGMIAQCDEDRRIAIEEKQMSAACKASELKAKLSGLLIDRIDQRVAQQIKVEVVRFSDGDGHA